MTPVFIKVTGSASESCDSEVPGFYRVDVRDGVPADRVVTAALDVFHANIAIACLEDFAIETVDENGNEMAEAADADSGTLELEKAGEIFYIDESEFPVPPTAPGLR